MPTIFTEPNRAGEFLVSEANGNRSRDAIVLAATVSDLEPGTVLGRVSIGAATAAAKSGGNTGTGTVSAVTVGGGAKSGVYSVRFTAATAFTVEDPDGFVLGAGATGTAWADDLGFTITAGGTAFVAGDGFDITVAAGSGAYVAVNPAATDGSQHFGAVLYAKAPANASTQTATGLSRDCEVHASYLAWPAGITTNQKNAIVAEMAAAGVIVRA